MNRSFNDVDVPTGKEALYGSLDPTTLEWTDGIFTKVLREASREICIVLQCVVRVLHIQNKVLFFSIQQYSSRAL